MIGSLDGNIDDFGEEEDVDRTDWDDFDDEDLNSLLFLGRMFCWITAEQRRPGVRVRSFARIPPML